MHELKTPYQRNRSMGRLKANTEPDKAPHTRSKRSRTKTQYGENHTTTTEARRPGQEKQLPKPMDLPGNKHPWTRQEELQPRSKWANKPSWRDNTPLCRVGDRGNPSSRGKPAPREGSPSKPSPSPPIKRNLT